MKAPSGQITDPVKFAYWLLLVIVIPHCQTSCPLRTIHLMLFSSIDGGNSVGERTLREEILLGGDFYWDGGLG